MMELQQRKTAFVQLGKVLKPLSQKAEWPGYACGLGESEYDELDELVDRVKHHNPWFTPENVRKAMAAWAENLDESVLEKWLKPYQPDIDSTAEPKRVGIVMAGNIPMVGFHDLLSVLITGHRAKAIREGKQQRRQRRRLWFQERNKEQGREVPLHQQGPKGPLLRSPCLTIWRRSAFLRRSTTKLWKCWVMMMTWTRILQN